MELERFLLSLFFIKTVWTKLVVDLIATNGYPVEDHINIETDDGYLLNMQRIPYGLSNENETEEIGGNSTSKGPVLLMHGILCSAETWVLTDPKKSLGFILADQGYDVWLGNARGSTHCKRHKTLSPLLPDFWDFSWHEVGVYDLPAMINYVLEETNQTELFYVGHSQGTTSFFVMASERPYFNRKIRLMVALAPVVYMSHLENPFFQVFSRLEGQVNWFVSVLGMSEFLPSSWLMSMAGQTFCNDNAPVQDVCANILFLIAGFDTAQMNKTELPAILTATPAGASTKQILHYAQEIASGDFQYYDYGMIMNFLTYDSTYPPRYRLERVTAPVALFYSKNDWLVSVQDVQRLRRRLPNVVYQELIRYDKFNHLDFLWANAVVEMVYAKVLDLLADF